MLENNQKPTIPLLLQDLGMIYPTESSSRKRRFGIYKCSCGTEFKAQTDGIKNGNTNSCGCYHKQRVSESQTTHGMTKNRIFTTWNEMIYRTSNPRHKSFKYYGKRGITVCERWLKVENFIEDMYPSFVEGLTIDRIDNDKGYSPDNCRWATRETQQQNTRKIKASNTSGYRGVSFNKNDNKWFSQIMINRNLKYLGSFNNALEAAKSYDTYVIDNNLEHTINGVLNV